MVLFGLRRAIRERIGIILHSLGHTKPICAISPADYRRSYNACLRKSTDIGELLLLAGVKAKTVTVTYRNKIGQLATMEVAVWQLAWPSYYTDGDGSGILYRQKATPNGTVLIQPLYMGMVNGGDEFDLINEALEGTPAKYELSAAA